MELYIFYGIIHVITKEDVDALADASERCFCNGLTPHHLKNFLSYFTCSTNVWYYFHIKITKEGKIYGTTF